MTEPIPITSRLVATSCYKCGIIFALPAAYHTQRREDGRNFWCPNGHGQHYPQPKKPTGVDPAELRKNAEALRRIHEMEQLDAREAEEAAKAAASGASAIISQMGQAAATDDAGGGEPVRFKTVVRGPDGRMQCPHCRLSYVCGASFATHLRSHHDYNQLDVEAAFRAMHRAEAEAKKKPPPAPDKVWWIGTKMHCPECCKGYAHGPALRTHLMARHGFTDAEADAAFTDTVRKPADAAGRKS